METNIKPNFYAYCRESIDLKTGIEIQKEKIKKYCEFHNINVAKWYIDNDASAFKYRPKYEKMIEDFFNDPNAKGVICSNLTRFGRKTTELLLISNRFREAKKEIILIDNNIDTTTTSGKAMFGMFSVFAEFERDTIKERIDAGKALARIKGTKSGLPMNRPKIEVDWKEYDKYSEMGLSTAAISKLIKDKRTGKPIGKSSLYVAVKGRTI